MPYKDPKKRKEQWRRWAIAHRNDSDRKRKSRIRALAKYVHKIPMVCIVKSCKDIGQRHHTDYSKPLEIIWLCKKHHDIVHAKPIKNCATKNCDNPHSAKGHCAKHYIQKFRPSRAKLHRLVTP